MYCRLLTRGALVVLASAAHCFDVPSAHAYHEVGQEWVNDTAYTLRGGELSLGIFQWQAGILDELTLGTFPILWAASPVVQHPVPNGYFKLRDWFHGPLAVALRGTALWVDGSKLLDSYTGSEDDEATFLVVGGNIAATYRTEGSLSFGPELAYTYVDVSGDSTSASLDGVAAASTLRAGAWVQWRLNHWLALQATGRVLLTRKEFGATATFEPDPSTTVEAKLYEEDPAPPGAWHVVPELALSGKYVNFLFGVGYGYPWLPVAGLVGTQPGVIVHLDFFVRFQLFGSAPPAAAAH